MPTLGLTVLRHRPGSQKLETVRQCHRAILDSIDRKPSSGPTAPIELSQVLRRTPLAPSRKTVWFAAGFRRVVRLAAPAWPLLQRSPHWSIGFETGVWMKMASATSSLQVKLFARGRCPTAQATERVALESLRETDHLGVPEDLSAPPMCTQIVRLPSIRETRRATVCSKPLCVLGPRYPPTWRSSISSETRQGRLPSHSTAYPP